MTFIIFERVYSASVHSCGNAVATIYLIRKKQKHQIWSVFFFPSRLNSAHSWNQETKIRPKKNKTKQELFLLILLVYSFTLISLASTLYLHVFIFCCFCFLLLLVWYDMVMIWYDMFQMFLHCSISRVEMFWKKENNI